MLDDFPKDHYHHRGLFWGWPEVETPATKSDIWLTNGIEPRFVRRLQMAGPTLEVENGWYTGAKRIVRETVRTDATPAKSGARTFNVPVTITLRGSHEKGKSYGGLSAPFADRAATTLSSADGPVAKDEDLFPLRWAQMDAVYGGRRATLRITPNPGNPHIRGASASMASSARPSRAAPTKSKAIPSTPNHPPQRPVTPAVLYHGF